ncbi:MAG TPA: hypothetical protein VIM16_06370 [Mucilaginibacter sp.]
MILLGFCRDATFCVSETNATAFKINFANIQARSQHSGPRRKILRLYSNCLYLQMLNLYFEGDSYKGKYRVSPARLPGWDYGSNGLYYLTICTQNRDHYFGEIISGQNTETQNSEVQNPETQNSETQNPETQNIASLRPTIIGEIAYRNWLDIPNHFSFVELNDFVIMPNHIHGILYINKPGNIDWQINKFGVQSQNLASVIRGYKASVKAYATTNNIEFGWQPRYYDHVIRNEKEYLYINGYIAGNPEQWLLNGDNVDNNILKP